MNDPDNVLLWSASNDALRQAIDKLSNAVQMTVGSKGGALGQAVQYRPGAGRSYHGGEAITDLVDTRGGRGVRKVYTEKYGGGGGEHAISENGEVRSIRNAKTSNDMNAGLTGFSQGFAMSAFDRLKFMSNVQKLQDAGNVLKVFHDSVAKTLTVQRFDPKRNTFVDVTGKDVMNAGGGGFGGSKLNTVFSVAAKSALEGNVGDRLVTMKSGKGGALGGVFDEGAIVYRDEDAISKTKSEKREDLKRLAAGQAEIVTAEMLERRPAEEKGASHGGGGADSQKEVREINRFRMWMQIYGMFRSTVARFGEDGRKISSALGGAIHGGQVGMSLGGPYGAAAGAIIGAAGSVYDLVLSRIRRNAQVTQDLGKENSRIVEKFGSAEKAAIAGNLGTGVTGSLMKLGVELDDKSGANTVSQFANAILAIRRGDRSSLQALALATGGSVNIGSSADDIFNAGRKSANEIVRGLRKNPKDIAMNKRAEAFQKAYGFDVYDFVHASDSRNETSVNRGRELIGKFNRTMENRRFEASLDMIHDTRVSRMAELRAKVMGMTNLDMNFNRKDAVKLQGEYGDLLMGGRLLDNEGKWNRDRAVKLVDSLTKYYTAEESKDLDLKALSDVGLVIKGDENKKTYREQLNALKNIHASLSPDVLERFSNNTATPEDAHLIMQHLSTAISSSGAYLPGVGDSDQVKNMFSSWSNITDLHSMLVEARGGKVDLGETIMFMLENGPVGNRKSSQRAAVRRFKKSANTYGSGEGLALEISDSKEKSVIPVDDVSSAMVETADGVHESEISETMQNASEAAHDAAESEAADTAPSAPSARTDTEAVPEGVGGPRQAGVGGGNMVVSITFNAKVDVSDKGTSPEKARAMVDSFGGEIEKRLAKIIFDAAPGNGTTLSA